GGVKKMRGGGGDGIGEGVAENVGVDVGGLGSKLDAQASRVRAARLAEADNSRLPLQRVAAQAVVMRIIAVEDGDAAWHQPFENLRLGVGDRLDRAKEAEMHRRHGGDDGDMWLDQSRELAELP